MIIKDAKLTIAPKKSANVINSVSLDSTKIMIVSIRNPTMVKLSPVIYLLATRFATEIGNAPASF